MSSSAWSSWIQIILRENKGRLSTFPGGTIIFWIIFKIWKIKHFRFPGGTQRELSRPIWMLQDPAGTDTALIQQNSHYFRQKANFLG